METNFTLSRLFVRLITVILISNFGVATVNAQSCACKETVQVSLDDTGVATVTASMLLADNQTCAGNQVVTVMLTPTGNAIPGSPVVNCSHAGKTLYGKVSNGTNSCWSKLIIEDKIAPVITCPTGILALTCTQMNTYKPAVFDNCGTFKLDTISENITVNNCNNGLASNVLKRIVRVYQATDKFGNKSALCTITIDVNRIPDLNAILMPPSYLVANATELECDGPWAKLANGNPNPLDIKNNLGVVTAQGTGVPSLNDLKLFPDPDLYCNLMITYTDNKLPKIGCVTKIMRTWTVIEWSCDNRSRAPYVQIIEIKDTKGPVIPAIKDITASTSNTTCEANVAFVNVVSTDNCAPASSITTDITIYPNGDLANPGVFIKHGSPKVAKLPVGTHIAVYTAYDDCYNSSTAAIYVTVLDNTPPVAICHEFTTIGLTSDGTAYVPASSFNNKSYDECELAKVVVRRMNTNNCACEIPVLPGFDLMGDYGTGANKKYYYLSKHTSTPEIAFKMAKALGGNVITITSAAQDTWVWNRFLELTPEIGLTGWTDLIIGLSDEKGNGNYVWQSGSTATYRNYGNGTPNTKHVVKYHDAAGTWYGYDPQFKAKYAIEISDICGFSSGVKFCCTDIGDNRMVVLRAIDASGNYNECMVSAVIQDKIGPKITCPADQTVNCDFAYDPKNLRKDFGWPVATDNCENPRLSQDSVINISSCRIGTIKRTFTVTDAGGRTASCTQTITFAPAENQVYQGPRINEWPADIMVNGCGNPSAYLPEVTGKPVLSDGVCSLVGAQSEDQTFSFNNPTSPACFKILRTWTVIDWCQPLQGGGYRTWKHTQEIKVIDNIAPVIATLAPVVSVDTYDLACASGSITLTASATDVCTTVLKWSYKIDAGNDGTFDIFQNGTGNSINASGNYPVGTHKIVYSFEDKCGNVSTKEQLFRIVNRKAPNAYVKNGLAMSLMKVGPRQGMAEIWATDFDNGSNHPCGYPVLLSFTPVTVNALGQMVGTPNLVFDCTNLGRNNVTIYVAALTPAGDVVQSSVVTFIDIQDNNNACTSGRATVKGSLATESNDKVQNVNVKLVGAEMNIITDAAGIFNFSDMPSGGNYTVTPEKNDDHLNGVSTLDLVLIQRHILALDKLNSPFKLIAADINKDGKITASDLVELRKLILGTTTGFANNNSWRFVDKGYTFQNVSFAQGEAFPETYNIENLTADMITDFTAVKVGDVNGNAKANHAAGNTEARTSSSLVLTTGNATFRQGDKVTIPVRVESGMDITGMQFTVVFDNEALTLVGVDPAAVNVNDHNFGFNAVGQGILTMSWNDIKPVHISNGQAIFNLTFTARDNGSIADMIQINSSETNAESYDADTKVMNVVWKVTERANDLSFMLHQNTPNPFKESTIIGFDLTESMQVSLSVFDVTGKTVKVINIQGNKGYNMIELNKNELNTGVLYYALKAGQYTATKKMVVID